MTFESKDLLKMIATRLENYRVEKRTVPRYSGGWHSIDGAQAELVTLRRILKAAQP